MWLVVIHGLRGLVWAFPASSVRGAVGRPPSRRGWPWFARPGFSRLRNPRVVAPPAPCGLIPDNGRNPRHPSGVAGQLSVTLYNLSPALIVKPIPHTKGRQPKGRRPTPLLPSSTGPIAYGKQPSRGYNDPNLRPPPNRVEATRKTAGQTRRVLLVQYKAEFRETPYIYFILFSFLFFRVSNIEEE